jgi:large subunit ribosomal protein L24
VIAGANKGKKGKVVKAIPQANKIVIDGVNIKKKHQRSRQQGKPGQVVEIAMPIHVSNVALEGKTKKK